MNWLTNFIGGVKPRQITGDGMEVRGYFANEEAVKQLNYYGLFDVARTLGYLNIKGSKVYVSGDILSGLDENGKTIGYGLSQIKKIEICQMLKYKKKFENIKKWFFIFLPDAGATFFLSFEDLKTFLKFGLKKDFEKVEKKKDVNEFIAAISENKKSCIFETGEVSEFFKILAECKK